MKYSYYRLDEVAGVISGSTPSTIKKEYYGGNILWATPKDLSSLDDIYIEDTDKKITEEGYKSCSTALLPAGAVLFSSRAPIGLIAIAKHEICTNQGFKNFVCDKDKLFPEYLYYCLRFYRPMIQGLGRGATFTEISKELISSFKIPVPPMERQKEIADVLVKTEQVIKKRRQTLRLADAFLKSAFLEMFGDPVKNPKKLDVVPCGAIASHVSSGSTPLGGDKTYLKEGILFIRSQNVLMNRLDLSDVAYISNEVHQRMKRTWVKKDDVLLNITGASIGRVAFFKGEDDTANVNQHVCIIRPDKSKVLPQYLSFLISMPNYQKTILGKNAGATRQALNFDQIKRFQIPLASLPEQQTFADLVQKVEKLKDKQKQSKTQLENLFSSLMQRAFRGEL